MEASFLLSCQLCHPYGLVWSLSLSVSARRFTAIYLSAGVAVSSSYWSESLDSSPSESSWFELAEHPSSSYPWNWVALHQGTPNSHGTSIMPTTSGACCDGIDLGTVFHCSPYFSQRCPNRTATWSIWSTFNLNSSYQLSILNAVAYRLRSMGSLARPPGIGDASLLDASSSLDRWHASCPCGTGMHGSASSSPRAAP